MATHTVNSLAENANSVDTQMANTTIKPSIKPSILKNAQNKYGLFDQNGKTILPYEYDVIEEPEWLPNHYYVGINNPNGSFDNQYLLGITTDKGKFILPMKYASIYYDKDFKRYQVSVLNRQKNNKLKQHFGFLDDFGKVVIPVIYDDLQRISNMGDEPTNLGTLNGKFGYINIVTGKVMIPFEYEQLNIGSSETDAQGKGVVVARKKELFGLITTSNEVVCPFKYDFIDNVYETNVDLAMTGDNLLSINFKNNKCVETPLPAVIYSSNFVARAPTSINLKPFDGMYAAIDYPTMKSALEGYKNNKLRWVAIPSLQINGDKAYIAFGQFVNFKPLMFNELAITKQKDGFSLMQDAEDTKPKKVPIKLLSFVQKGGLMFCSACQSLNLPSYWQKIRAEERAAFVGIGIAIGKANETAFIEIKEVLVSGAADKAGLKAGDLITKINGLDTSKHSLTDATTKIRGEPGTEVKLEVVRNGKLLMPPIVVIRSKVKIN